MRDPRVKKLASLLLDHSIGIEPEETLYIEVVEDGVDLAKELVRECYKRGAYPFVDLINQEIARLEIEGTTLKRSKLKQKWDLFKLEDIKATIRIYGHKNDRENSNVPEEKRQLNRTLNKACLDKLIEDTKWVLMNYPNHFQAQKAGMSLEAFEDFYFDICTLDYSHMEKAMKPLKDLMDKTNNVRIMGNGIDLSFSIEGIKSVICAGKNNIPDGEIYTAPVKDSVNGYITFNTTTTYSGTSFENIRLEFKDGKIINAQSNENQKLEQILNTDEGARYIGEFALGVNPYILHPMNNTLFDEKIAGSFHFTPGQSYRDETYNHNDSKIHWDMVHIQRADYGGGEIWFDGKLVRKDGLFVLDNLLDLNPENLKNNSFEKSITN